MSRMISRTSRLRPLLAVVLWLLYALSMVVNLWFWGGLASVPRLGTTVSAVIYNQVSLSATYFGLGRIALDKLGQARPAAIRSEALLSDSVDGLLAAPSGLLVARVIAGQPAWQRLSHYAAPWLLLAALTLQALAPKAVRITSRRR
jgi:hypothetical protein